MKRYVSLFIIFSFLIVPCVSAQVTTEKYDSAAVAKITDEGMNRSQVMETLSYLTDVYGPRLTWSVGYKQAAEWAQAKLAALGLQNAHIEAFDPTGRGWTLNRYSANVLGKQNFPLISYPKAWSPGTKGMVTGDVVYLDVSKDSTLAMYKGTLKGKFVLFDDSRPVNAHFEPEGRRIADSTLLQMSNADMQRPGGRFQFAGRQRTMMMLNNRKLQLCQDEGAAAILTISRGDGGTIFVQNASVPNHPDTPFVNWKQPYSADAPKFAPQIAVGIEHYNRLLRMLEKGEKIKIEMNLDVAFTKVDSGYNIIAEIPGTDLKDEVVMIGAHFDSWHGGTGATDNGTGSAVCIEALRILKALDLKPRRTIRIGLWGGEEQGLLGSRAYVKEHLGEREGSFMDPRGGNIKLKPAAEKFSVYFNNDNGTGKVRGVYMQGNESARPVFRNWLIPFKKMDAATITPLNTGGTDHLSFDGIGLPGFQFIQDPIEYDTRTHHSNMDVYDRAQPEDLKQAAVIMAAFAYNAAMRDEKFPRKSPTPTIQSSR
jgi:hypothetical protein